MNEEELRRLEEGSPASVAETVVLLAICLGVVGLIGFIVFGVLL